MNIPNSICILVARDTSKIRSFRDKVQNIYDIVKKTYFLNIISRVEGLTPNILFRFW